MATPETTLKKQFVDKLRESGFWVYVPQDSQHRGIPDVLASRRSLFFACELKVLPRKLEPLQRVVLRDISKSETIASCLTYNPDKDEYIWESIQGKRETITTFKTLNEVIVFILTLLEDKVFENDLLRS